MQHHAFTLSKNLILRGVFLKTAVTYILKLSVRGL